MKIETLRDPIPTYDKAAREKLQARRVRLSRTVNRDKESANQRPENQSLQQETNEETEDQLSSQDSSTEEIRVPDGAAVHGEGLTQGHSLDVVV